MIRLMKYLIASCCCLLFASCYDSMLDSLGANEMVAEGGSYVDTIPSAELASQFLREGQLRVVDTRVHKYQYQYNLHIDDYAGYMSVTHNFKGKVASSFAFNDDFASGPKDNLTWVVQQTIPVMNGTEKLHIEPLGAMATIMFAYAAHQYTSIHGPFPYRDYKALKERNPLYYDKLSDIYTWLFDDLDKAVAYLEKYQADPNADMDFIIETTDLASGMTNASAIVSQWLKLAHSLRLRMAMNIVKVDDYVYKGLTVRQIAEDAVLKGVFQPGDPTFGIRPAQVEEAINHPLFKISKDWQDTRLNASLENILKRTKNPLMERWFNKNLGDLRNVNKKLTLTKGEKYIGIRSGTYLRDRSYDQDYKLFSDLNDLIMKDAVAWFKVEEVLFLQAEGALRGWNMGGSAESFYNAGIQEAFTKNSVGEKYTEYMSFKGMGDNSISEEDRIEGYYQDYYDPDNNIPKWDGYYMLNNAWAGVDTNPYTAMGNNEKELQLQKIITQKWIALFPMSPVAWADYRRTSYPRLLPACDFAYSDADGSILEDQINWATGETINKGLYIRRMPYSTKGDKEIREEINTSGLDALGEGKQQLPDKQGTRLWWDFDKSNF